jgi:hypothetical protein
MLYPLNALISSQEERLLRWFQPFEGNLRYCLYNGETPEDVRDEAGRREPWKVLDRRTLRSSPPPVLVTNVTMLEYMLIRQKDAPILEASRGKLDFVVLDEAHTYVGAQAAEIALLLRRVALAFGRRPEELRYVATSATVGGDGTDQLKTFLRDLSGAPHDRVHVVRGRRAPLPPAERNERVTFTVEELATLEERVSGAKLAQSEALRSVREELRGGTIIGWTAWRSRCEKILRLKGIDDTQAMSFLVEAARARDPNAELALARAGADHVLPVRVHLFHRTLSGIWACVNSDCPGRPLPTAGQSDWPFGAVFLEPREHCPHCGSIVLEWAFCSQCGEGALKAEEHDGGDRIGAWRDKGLDDDFAQTLELEENYGAEDDEERDSLDLDAVAPRRYLLPPTAKGIPHFRVELGSGRIMSASAADGLDLTATRDVGSCPHCAAAPKRLAANRGALRSLAAGSPYLMSQITPGFLTNLSGDAVGFGEHLPFGGRRLITFTDARQGTARHAANIQIASERNFIRGFVYHFVQERPTVDQSRLKELDRQIQSLLEHEADPTFRAILEEKRQQRAKLTGEQFTSKKWSDLVDRLASDATVSEFLSDIWSSRDQEFADPSRLSEFLLYRELMRRPLRANSAETLGLFRFLIPGVDETIATVPSAASALQMDLADWRDLLRLIVTHFVRANVILDFDRGWLRWVDRRQSHPQMVPWEPNTRAERYVRFWPHPYGNRPSRIVRLLIQVLRLEMDSKSDRDRLHELMRAAWSTLKRFMVPTSDGFRFRLGDLSVDRIEHAFWCPVTRRILDTTFRGFSPYDRNGMHPRTEKLELPSLAYPWNRTDSGTRVAEDEIESWLSTDERIWVLHTGELARFCLFRSGLKYRDDTLIIAKPAAIA